MNRIIIVILVIASCAGGYFYLKNGKSVQKFRTEKVVAGDIVESVTATGTVNAVTTVLVGTQVSGTVKKIHADFNSAVKKGQLIAEIDPTSFEAQVDQARANVLNARANFEKAQAALNDAKRTAKRSSELFSKGYISRNELDTAETALESAAAQALGAKAQIAQTEAALKIAETNLIYTRIVSPVDGIVISRNVDVGQTVAASFQTPTLFNIAQDLSRMQIDANVDESDIGRVMLGQNVEFTVDAYPDVTFKGAVTQIRNAPINVQNVVTYDVVIKVDNTGLRLKPGMTANVSIIISVKKDALKIPNAALRFRPSEKGKSKTADKKGQTVYILENDKPKRIPVTAGPSDGNYTEVLSGEVKEGQEVIIEAIGGNTDKPRPSGPPRMM